MYFLDFLFLSRDNDELNLNNSNLKITYNLLTPMNNVQCIRNYCSLYYVNIRVLRVGSAGVSYICVPSVCT